MTKQISGFSKAVLAEYIRRHSYAVEIIRDLQYIEYRLEYEKTQREVDRIIDAKTEPYPVDDLAEIIKRSTRSLADSKRLDVLWARQERLSKLMFPDAPSMTKAEKDERG